MNKKNLITEITRGPADLVEPSKIPEGNPLRYGLGIPFQVAPRQVGMFCNLRNEGYPVGDFENGTDVVIFDDPANISADHAIPVTRNDKYRDSESDEPRIVLKHQTVGGFIPFGALREDGRLHPHAGTGFGLNQANDYPMKGNGYYDKVDKRTRMVRNLEIHQLAFDGNGFRVVESERVTPDAPLKAPGSDWALIWGGFVQGIADGDDILYAITATGGDPSTWRSPPMATGVSRWRCLDGRWRPVEFTPVIFSEDPMRLIWLEPSLVRDTDGSLLFSIRGSADPGLTPDAPTTLNHTIRVWRSQDGGKDWQTIIDLPDARGQAPVTLNCAADGTPYIVACKLGHEREWLCIWPLNEDRTGLEAPVTVRNAREEFGPAPVGPVWFMDHQNGQTVQLADGSWHHLLAYRIMDRGEHSGAAPASQTGLYVEEVISADRPVPTWKFE